jgi:hypothetical protein
MADRPQLTYEQLAAIHGEIIRRARVISDKLERLEFTGTPGVVDEAAVTATAVLYAALVRLAPIMPLHVLIQLLGAVYGVAQEVLVEQLLDRIEATVNEQILRHAPTKGTVN